MAESKMESKSIFLKVSRLLEFSSMSNFLNIVIAYWSNKQHKERVWNGILWPARLYTINLADSIIFFLKIILFSPTAFPSLKFAHLYLQSAFENLGLSSGYPDLNDIGRALKT